MKNISQLKKNLRKDFSNLKEVKVSLLGDSATQFLGQALKGCGYEHQLNINLLEADFNQIERQVLDTSSEMYDFQPDVVILFKSAKKLLSKYDKSTVESRVDFAKNELENIKTLSKNIREGVKDVKIILLNFPEINDSIYGNFANKHSGSFLYQVRKLNFEMMNYAIEHGDVFIADAQSLQNTFGRDTYFSPNIYINTDMVLSLDIIPHLANRIVQILSAIQGRITKCVIIDLDNTTWGGIIGDDGIENIQVGDLGIGKAFTEFQYWIKKLKQRGIIVAVCSKNTESIAKEPFENHPDMILRMKDISIFVANWDNKADNIKHIQSVLNIGFDSMVFIDDNPFERNIVRENIPQIRVPEIPEDPAMYLEFLYSLNLFETSNVSSEDSKRTEMYQTEAKRVALKKSITNEKDFLENLEMVSDIKEFDKFNTPRVAQLSQRSNQFNLRTIRYTEEEISSIAVSNEHFTFTFTLEDRFGNNGLICVVILKINSNEELFIDTWFMSCRVLKRDMENFVLNRLVDKAKEKGFKYLVGEYVSTPKNALVEDHYSKLGFLAKKHKWSLEIATYQQKKNYIKIKSN